MAYNYAMKLYETEYVPLKSFSTPVRVLISLRIRSKLMHLDDVRARSYRADIVLMLNRGLRRLTVCCIQSDALRRLIPSRSA